MLFEKLASIAQHNTLGAYFEALQYVCEKSHIIFLFPTIDSRVICM